MAPEFFPSGRLRRCAWLHHTGNLAPERGTNGGLLEVSKDLNGHFAVNFSRKIVCRDLGL